MKLIRIYVFCFGKLTSSVSLTYNLCIWYGQIKIRKKYFSEQKSNNIIQYKMFLWQRRPSPHSKSLYSFLCPIAFKKSKYFLHAKFLEVHNLKYGYFSLENFFSIKWCIRLYLVPWQRALRNVKYFLVLFTPVE